MKTKIYIILALCFGLLKTFAQSYEEQYLQEEATRLNQVQIIENEIQVFINQNINNYDFTQVINIVNNLKDEEGNSLSGNPYQEALLYAKNQKLKDIFFQQNPEKLKYFYAATLKQQCLNGGFETGTTAGFSMGTRAYNPPNWSAYNMFPPASPQSFITLVDNTVPDPLIGAPLARVNTGRFAIRVNNSVNGQYDVSMLTRQFVVNENNISFAYALVFGDSISHFATGDNPYYQVRLLNSNNIPVYTRNVMLNPGNSFFINLQNTQIFYTNWLCERINTSGLMGQTVTLQIIMADCGGSAHWGYGYFDDFCGITCNQPAFNPTISLNPVGRACPTFPLPITGNISLPNNAFFTNVTIQVLDSSNNVVSSIINSSAPGGFFSTNLNYDNFYPNGYNINTDFNIRALLNYTINGVSQTPIIANNTNPPGPDVSFKNCTVPCREDWYFTTNQPIQTSTNFQASCCITSESLINPNLNVEFRAGYEINLKPNPNGTAGFYATSHQSGNFHAYIARCDESDSFSEAQKQSKTITERTSDESDIKIYPNPASTYINIDSGNEKITSWELVDISGRSILKGNSKQVNVQGLTKSNYILKINTKNKQVTKKVIVN